MMVINLLYSDIPNDEVPNKFAILENIELL